MNTILSKCPMCKSEINEGAVACKSCGATEIDAWDAMGIIKKWSIAFIPMVMAFMLGCMVLIFSPKVGLLIIAAGIAWFFFYRQSNKNKRVWATSASRKRI